MLRASSTRAAQRPAGQGGRGRGGAGPRPRGAGQRAADTASNSVIIRPRAQVPRDRQHPARDGCAPAAVLIEAAIVETSKQLTDGADRGRGDRGHQRRRHREQLARPPAQRRGEVALLTRSRPACGAPPRCPAAVTCPSADHPGAADRHRQPGAVAPVPDDQRQPEASISTNEQTTHAPPNFTQTSTSTGFTPIEAGIADHPPSSPPATTCGRSRSRSATTSRRPTCRARRRTRPSARWRRR